jgi:hypothetical protein
MRRFQAKGRRTDGDVFCSALFGRAVLYPLARVGYNRLAGTNIEGASSVSDPQHTFQNDSELLEFWRLPWLHPAARTSQESDTDLNVAGIDLPDVLVDDEGACWSWIQFESVWKSELASCRLLVGRFELQLVAGCLLMATPKILSNLRASSLIACLLDLKLHGVPRSAAARAQLDPVLQLVPHLRQGLVTRGAGYLYGAE